MRAYGWGKVRNMSWIWDGGEEGDFMMIFNLKITMGSIMIHLMPHVHEVSYEHPGGIRSSWWPHRPRATCVQEVVMVELLALLTFLIHKSLTPSSLIFFTLFLKLVTNMMIYWYCWCWCWYWLLNATTVADALALALSLILDHLRHRWGQPRYIDLMAGCKYFLKTLSELKTNKWGGEGGGIIRQIIMLRKSGWFKKWVTFDPICDIQDKTGCNLETFSDYHQGESASGGI